LCHRGYSSSVGFPWDQIQDWLGKRYNNYAELIALKLSLRLAADKGAQKVQVFGDFQLVINWMKGSYQCEDFLLQPILNEILTLQTVFISISYQHIYMERNSWEDGLSKGVSLEPGCWKIWEVENGLFSESEQFLLKIKRCFVYNLCELGKSDTSFGILYIWTVVSFLCFCPGNRGYSEGYIMTCTSC
jgi:hypothetical protein